MSNKNLRNFPEKVSIIDNDVLHLNDSVSSQDRKVKFVTVKEEVLNTPTITGAATLSGGVDSGLVINSGNLNVVNEINNLLSSNRFIHSDGITYNDIFDKLAPYVPEGSDPHKCTGGKSNLTLSRFARISATEITLYGFQHTSNIVGTFTVTDGSAATTDLSMAW